MDDTPYIHDGADASLRKTVSLLNKIEAKTGSATITGAVTVNNEVEIKNTENNPIPVSDNGGSLTVDGTVELGATSLSALENIQVTFPSTQNVSVQNTSLAVTGTFFQETQPVSATALPLPSGASTESTLTGLNTKIPSNLTVSSTRLLVDGSGVTQPVSDNGGSLTVDGTVTINDMTSGNAKTKIVDSTGADVSYIPAGTAGTPSSSVLSVQGISGGTSLPISGTVDTGLTQPLTDTQLRAAAVLVSGAFFQATQPISGTVNTYPQQGTTATNTDFSSLTSAQLAPAVANRESLTVYNEGSGTLFINVGASCSTTSYQVRLLAGDYWEAPQGQVSLQHSGIFGTSGTGRVTQVS